MNKSIVLTLSFLLILLQGISQKKTISTDPDKFIQSLGKVMETSNKGKSKEVMAELGEIWLSSFYSMEEKKRIIDFYKSMEKLKMRPFPDMGNYALVLGFFYRKDISKKEFETWQEILEELAKNKRKKRNLSTFIDFSTTFYNNHSIYETRNGLLNWRADGGEYQLGYDNEPFIDFKSIDLVCRSKNDSIRILKTNGVFRPIKKEWTGKEGLVTWENVGVKSDEVFANLKIYRIDVKRAEYQADSVLFINKTYYKTPLLGSLNDKVQKDIKTIERRSYPRFESYDKRLPIKNIIKNVDYDGGFSQRGGRFIGAGTSDNPARLIFYREGAPFVVAEAKSFLIRMNQEEEDEEERSWFRRKKEKKKKARNRIVSSAARIIMYIKEDSIVHPGLSMKLYTDDRVLELLRTDMGIAQSPFYNTYHSVEMAFEQATWKIDDPLIEFKSLKTTSEKRATFTSIDYFRGVDFDKLMGAADWHPLSRLQDCEENFGGEVTLGTVASCMQLPVSQIEPMMIRYSIMGYVGYNTESKLVTFLPKLTHHVLSKSKLVDYDIIKVHSNANGVQGGINATLNLMNFDLNIRGVNRVILSDTRAVQVFPKSQRLIMKKNRDMTFDGMVSAGKAELFGKSFYFSYNDFKIDMPVVDSMQLWADTPKKDSKGRKQEVRVRTLIETLTGELVIDEPNNKSAIKEGPEFPTFTSFKDSYAYYQKKEIYNNVYKKDNFYFQVKPFELDSLKNMSNDQMQFEGLFSSAGIFADLDETLKLQEDYSLGFIRMTPPEGESTYGGAGTFENEISLSNKGLKGDGNLKYVTSISQSKDFTFFPDSTNGITHQYDIEEQLGTIEYPNVTADTVFVHWMPYLDYMDVETMKGKKPINMFASVAEHTGKLKYSSKELIGSGKNSFEGGTMYSNKMLFKFQEIFADTADFEIAKNLFDALDFKSSNLNAHVNFKTREAKFQSNVGGSLTVFDVCQYQAWLDRFTWFMDADEVEFSSGGGQVDSGADQLQLEGAQFKSIHPQQDSLSFFAKSASYSLLNKIITAKEVEFIEVADAEIYPSDGRVIIHREADMQTLDAAKVIANRKLRYHTVFNSEIKITGRWNYSGNGLYNYEDKNGKVQTIEIVELGVDSTQQTHGKGEVLEENNFSLSPQINYKGTVNLEANRQNLLFKGYGQLNHQCSEITKAWFRFESEIDPEDIRIEINQQLMSDAGTELYSGFMMTGDSGRTYGSFMSPRDSKEDLVTTPIDGFLIYDDANTSYKVSTNSKLNERTLPGNYVSLNTKTCQSEGEGKLNFAHKTGLLKMTTLGNYKFNSVNKEFESDAMIVLDFLIDDKIMEIMAKDLNENENVEGVTLNEQVYEVGLRDLLGQEEADALLGKQALGKTVKVADEMRKPLVINKVKLKWDTDGKRLYSIGKIGINNILKEQVNKEVKGAVEIIHKNRGSNFTVYLELTPSSWYVFTYRSSNGMMKVYSSNKEFNAAIDEVKKDKKRIKGNKKNKGYVYLKGTKRQRSEILKRFDGL